ncbi:MAG: THUMP domain-containing protein [Bacteroidota bacterium]
MKNKNESKFPLVVKTLLGLEDILAQELKEIGATDIETGKRVVYCTGSQEIMYKANYWCRTALHVLKPIASFDIVTEDDLYNKINKIKWEDLLSTRGTLSVDAVVSNSIFTHSHYVSLRTKDAIVDRFRDMFDMRPNVEIENPDLRINVHLSKNKCDISLDSSGYSLHKRGYRVQTGVAPLSEVLAAGIILLSGWDKQSNFIDPMCGSGTIVTEAALIALNIPPGYYRKSFGFEKWKDFDSELWDKIKTDAFDLQADFEGEIWGSDISETAIEVAIENATKAKLHKDISFYVESMQTQLPPEGGGVMVINPPYGERIKPDDIVQLYKEIGDALKQNYKGYSAWIISSDLNALKHIGLKPTKKIAINNGPLECKLHKFEIFEGSRYKKPKEESASEED